ncbi:MAG: hypothetical protein KTR14_03345 [Vampirovibrio sp.]|nr:hypothetical protein [Vampirovibrio sp.]
MMTRDFSVFRQILPVLMGFALLCSGFSSDLPAEAKKKKGGGDAEVQKSLDEFKENLQSLLIKSQSRYIFSPKESGELAEIKFKLMDLMQSNPTSTALVTPVYQTGIIYVAREGYLDAYELFSFIAGNFPDNPYATRSKSMLNRLKSNIEPGMVSQEADATNELADAEDMSEPTQTP